MPEAVFFVLDAPVRSMVAIQSGDPPLLHPNHRVFWFHGLTHLVCCHCSVGRTKNIRQGINNRERSELLYGGVRPFSVALLTKILMIGIIRSLTYYNGVIL